MGKKWMVFEACLLRKRGDRDEDVGCSRAFGEVREQEMRE